MKTLPTYRILLRTANSFFLGRRISLQTLSTQFHRKTRVFDRLHSHLILFYKTLTSNTHLKKKSYSRVRAPEMQARGNPFEQIPESTWSDSDRRENFMLSCQESTYRIGASRGCNFNAWSLRRPQREGTFVLQGSRVVLLESTSKCEHFAEYRSSHET